MARVNASACMRTGCGGPDVGSPAVVLQGLSARASRGSDTGCRRGDQPGMAGRVLGREDLVPLALSGRGRVGQC